MTTNNNDFNKGEDVLIYDPSETGKSSRPEKREGGSGWWYEPEPDKGRKKRRWTFLQSSSRHQKIAGLDALRTIAIVFIILYHMFPYTIKGGYLGVCLFLMLSGFLMANADEIRFPDEDDKAGGEDGISGRIAAAYSNFSHRRYEAGFLNRLEKTLQKVLGFYVKRIVRIYPALIITVLSVCGIYRIFASDTMVNVRQEVLATLAGYNNWWQVHNNASYFDQAGNYSPFTHMWYMGLILQLYLIWPFLSMLIEWLADRLGERICLRILAGSVLVLALPMIIGSFLGVNTTRLYYGTDTRIFSFMIGVFAAKLQRWIPVEVRIRQYLVSRMVMRRPGVAYLILWAILLAACIFLPGESAFVYRGGMLLINVIMGIVLAITAFEKFPFGEMLEQPFLKQISRYSYEAYLWMYPVIFLFGYRKWSIPFISAVLQILIIAGLSVWTHKAAAFAVEQIRRIMNGQEEE